MRSRILVGGLVSVLLVSIVATCRQPASNSQTRAEPAAPSSTEGALQSEAVTPISEQWPGLTESSRVRSVTSNAASPRTSQDAVGQVAILTAEDVDAVINVRALPSPTGDPIGVGQVGDPVILGRSETADDGYTWHYVTFENSSIVGWIRDDLLEIQPAEPTATTASEVTTSSTSYSDVLKQALNEQCGNVKAIEAYFVSQNHTMYVCKVRSKRIFVSQESGTEQVITAQEVEALGGGYIISNGNFEYRLDSGNFVVVRFDDSGRQEEVLREPIVYTERY
jgi:hypothetical protein